LIVKKESSYYDTTVFKSCCTQPPLYSSSSSHSKQPPPSLEMCLPFLFSRLNPDSTPRTYLLLINLAVADLLAGVGEVCVLVFHRIPRTEIKSLSVWWAVQVFGLSVSLMFLALISLERVYAVFWPLRHRVTSARAYNFSIVIAWVIGLCLTGLSVFVDSISHQCGYRLCRCCC